MTRRIEITDVETGTRNELSAERRAMRLESAKIGTGAKPPRRRRNAGAQWRKKPDNDAWIYNHKPHSVSAPCPICAARFPDEQLDFA